MKNSFAIATAKAFYVVGGTLRRDAPSYIPREADRRLYEALNNGEVCYILTARQMGKSSLMVRTAARLREEGVAVAVLDLTALGQNLTTEQWYLGLLERVGQQLGLDDQLEEFWFEHQPLGPLQRWMLAVRQVVLSYHAGRQLVIFVDEIDVVRSLNFSTDEFFAGIRELYNRRAQEPELRRLNFCLLGVATPSDLIRDTRTTPFNIGQRIELSDFTAHEAAPLARGFELDPRTELHLLRRVLYWTGGHPYLTQRLCQAVAEHSDHTRANVVDQVCEELFLSHRARERDDNLLFVRERMLRSEADTASLLTLYGKIRRGEKVADDESNPLVGVLRLSGIVRSKEGRLHVRNRVYERVFDHKWVASNLPGAEVRRQRRAFRRGLRIAALTALPLLVLAILTAVYYAYFGSYMVSNEPPAMRTTNPPPAFWAAFSAQDAALASTGVLLIHVSEPGAKVWINNEEFGRTNEKGMMTVAGLSTGNYAVRVEKAGFPAITQQAAVEAARPTQLNFKLQIPPAAPLLLVQNAPPGSTVLLDGHEVGTTESDGTFTLTGHPGVHLIKIAKEGFQVQEVQENLRLGTRAILNASLKPDAETERWSRVLSGSAIPSSYLKEYPNGRYANQARALAEQRDWTTARDSRDILALTNFVNSYPQSQHAAQARVAIRALQEQETAWLTAKRSHDVAQLQAYVGKYPDSQYTAAAKEEISHLQNETEVNSVIRGYEAAYNQKDFKELQHLWPTMTPTVQRALAQLFKNAQMVKLTLKIIKQPEFLGNTASVQCETIRDTVLPEAAPVHVVENVTIRLSKVNDRWVIQKAPT